MSVYSPPLADIANATPPLSRRKKVLWLGLIVVGGFVTTACTFFAVGLVPNVAGSPALGVASLLLKAATAAVLGALPWWRPMARMFGRSAPLAGLLAASGPVGLRVSFMSGWPTDPLSSTVAGIDIFGVLLAFMGGAFWAAREMGANNSSRPTPLCGAT